MIIYVYPADEFGCGEYRLAMPARAARALGHDVRLVMPSEREGIGGEIDGRTGKLTSLRFPRDADVIVIQRVSFATMAEAIPTMRARGTAVVVDMDDWVTRIDPSNPAFYGYHEKYGHALHNSRNIEAACRDATLVTVSTPALLPVYAGHGRGRVLENRVPARYLNLPHEDAATVGWGGSIHSHPRDLQELGPAVARIVRDGFEYWGAGPNYEAEVGDDGVRRALGLTAPGDDQLEVDTTGDMKMADWATAVATMGVGVAPLADTDFNRAKSWLKPLEYMACGVPWVGSPRAEYARLAELTGVGLMAERERDWYARLKRLMTDRAFRIEQSQAGRRAVAEHPFQLTYEAAAWRWVEAWEHAADLQQGRARARAVVA